MVLPSTSPICEAWRLLVLCNRIFLECSTHTNEYDSFGMSKQIFFLKTQQLIETSMSSDYKSALDKEEQIKELHSKLGRFFQIS
jgi:hypothetical protein